MSKNKNLWKNNEIQFARLICEIMACVEITNGEFKEICESMDLSHEEVDELIDRAEKVWEESKRRHLT